MIIVGLGANLPHPEYGPPANTLETAISAIQDRNIQVLRRSRWYLSPPWPDSLSAQPWYVNGAILLDTEMGPDRLLQVLHEIEWSFGRVHAKRWAPRCIDLDLIDHHGAGDSGGGKRCVAELPHPRMAERAFVLAPMQEIAPDWVHPESGLSVAELLAATGQHGVEPLTGESENHLAGVAGGG